MWLWFRRRTSNERLALGVAALILALVCAGYEVLRLVGSTICPSCEAMPDFVPHRSVSWSLVGAAAAFAVAGLGLLITSASRSGRGPERAR